MNGECLLPIPISNSVQFNSVPKLVVARNVSLHWNPACSERDNDAFGDERFDGIEPSTLQASLLFPVDPSLSLESADEPDNWSADAKLKLKVGVMSVTVKQHTEDWLQGSQSIIDL